MRLKEAWRRLNRGANEFCGFFVTPLGFKSEHLHIELLYPDGNGIANPEFRGGPRCLARYC